MEVLEFGRSSVTFRIHLDRMRPQSVSHKPPYGLDNPRVQLGSRLRITERRVYHYATPIRIDQVRSDIFSTATTAEAQHRRVRLPVVERTQGGLGA